MSIKFSNYEKCPICGKVDFLKNHKCDPIWETFVEDEDDTEKWTKIYACGPQEAACKRAEDLDQYDHCVLETGPIEIIVRKDKDSPAFYFNCSAEAEVVYYADLIDERDI
jgi:hypothetical protein